MQPSSRSLPHHSRGRDCKRRVLTVHPSLRSLPHHSRGRGPQEESTACAPFLTATPQQREGAARGEYRLCTLPHCYTTAEGGGCKRRVPTVHPSSLLHHSRGRGLQEESTDCAPFLTAAPQQREGAARGEYRLCTLPHCRTTAEGGGCKRRVPTVHPSSLPHHSRGRGLQEESTDCAPFLTAAPQQREGAARGEYRLCTLPHCRTTAEGGGCKRRVPTVHPSSLPHHSRGRGLQEESTDCAPFLTAAPQQREGAARGEYRLCTLPHCRTIAEGGGCKRRVPTVHPSSLLHHSRGRGLQEESTDYASFLTATPQQRGLHARGEYRLCTLPHCHTFKDVLNYMVESQAGRECTCEYSSGVETVAAIPALAATLFRLQINTN